MRHFLHQVLLRMPSSVLTSDNLRHIATIMNAFSRSRTRNPTLFQYMSNAAIECIRGGSRAQVWEKGAAGGQTIALMMQVCVYIYVCQRERERERESIDAYMHGITRM